LATAVVLTTAAAVFALLPPLAMRFLLDHVVTVRQWQLLGVAVGLVVFLPLWNSAVNMLNRFLIASIGQRLVVDLRTGLYRHVLNLSLRFHGENGAGPVMNKLMTDVGLVQQMITGETLGIVSNLVILVFGLGLAFYLNWHLALVLVFMLVLYTINYYRFGQRIRAANLELREIMDQVSGRLQERLAGVRLVKTYCRERDETEAFLNSTDRALQFGQRGQMLSVSLSATARLIGGIGSTIIYCGAAWYILMGWRLARLTLAWGALPVLGLHLPWPAGAHLVAQTMSYGDMLALDTYVWTVVNPAISLTTVAGSITQALVSLDRILDVLREQPEIVDTPDAADLPEDVRGDLRLEGVIFGYGDKPLFNGLHLHLPAGKMTALVGHTGCGKTTVTSLLLRLWDVQGGAVTLDGHDVRAVTLRSLRRHTGVVPQEPVVFEGTVHDNIAYAHPEATAAQVEEAARAAQIHDYIATLPEGYATWLGKDGAKLSVGQKQRVAIARAILRKPAVLILDEATSSLDSESEAALQEAMRTVLHGRTSVVVAHRLSTIVEADQIIAMDRGRILEIGTHDELMARENGFYRRLYEELKGKQHRGEVEP
jgi:subfamily B ATP-binding cassette protein MsbA